MALWMEVAGGYVAGRICYSLLRWFTEMYLFVFPRGRD